MKKIYNGTSHSINILRTIDYNPRMRRYTAEVVDIITSIPSDGELGVTIRTTETGPIAVIPVFDREILDCDPLPDGYDIVVVSDLYAEAYKRTHGNDKRLYVVLNPVYDPDGCTVLGNMGICPAF